jgi:hypothetical protein
MNVINILDYWGNTRHLKRKQLNLQNDYLGMAIICVNGSIVLPFVLAAGVVYFDLDVFRYVLNSVPPPPLFRIVLRFVSISALFYGCWLILSSMFILMAVFLQPPLYLMTKLAKLVNNREGKLGVKLLLRKQMTSVFLIHNEIYLLCDFASRTLNYLLVFLLLIGILLCAVCDYATVRFFSGSTELPWFVESLLFILSLVIKIIIAVLFPQASGVFESSTISRRGLKSVVLTKYESRKLRAIRDARISFGSLFHAKKSTKCCYFRTIFDATVNAVLVF